MRASRLRTTRPWWGLSAQCVRHLNAHAAHLSPAPTAGFSPAPNDGACVMVDPSLDDRRLHRAHRRGLRIGAASPMAAGGNPRSFRPRRSAPRRRVGSSRAGAGRGVGHAGPWAP
ncbi:MAG: hypothetical protein ACLTDR_00255 [Adlercreutzia equolifaciens]